MSNYADSFIKNVLLRLEELEINKSDLARRMNVPHSMVSRYLLGRQKPGIEVIEAWEKALEMEPGSLLRSQLVTRGTVPPQQNSLDAEQMKFLKEVLALSPDNFRDFASKSQTFLKVYKKKQVISDAC